MCNGDKIKQLQNYETNIGHKTACLSKSTIHKYMYMYIYTSYIYSQNIYTYIYIYTCIYIYIYIYIFPKCKYIDIYIMLFWRHPLVKLQSYSSKY